MSVFIVKIPLLGCFYKKKKTFQGGCLNTPLTPISKKGVFKRPKHPPPRYAYGNRCLDDRLLLRSPQLFLISMLKGITLYMLYSVTDH